MKTLKYVILILGLLLVQKSEAATHTAASLSPGDVQTAMNAASAGDTVQLPAGALTWSSGVTYSGPANVTIKGAGTTATGGGDMTVIRDGVGTGGNFFQVNCPSTGNIRLSGITFQSAGGGNKDAGTIEIYGPGFIRIDHCHFDFSDNNNNYKVMNFGAGAFGVIDHCILDLRGISSIYLYNGRQGADPHNMGNYEWSLPTNLGGPDYLYIEDNIMNGIPTWSIYDGRVFDGFTGAKVVVRFNTMSALVMGETHATGHSHQDDRGVRAQEIYGNLVTSPLQRDPNFCMVDFGNGTGVCWGNSSGNVYKNMFLMKLTRADAGTYSQTATPGGWGYAGTQFNGQGSIWDGGTALGTDTVTGYPCLDQVGRGQGQLLTGVGGAKINSVTGTQFWPNQALEPVYIWDNTGQHMAGWGGNYYANSSGGRIQANRDYYPAASGIQVSSSSPFNGTSGTGWGTLANRPATCTQGVAYWATDQGSWNTSSSNPYGVQRSGADGVLYKAVAANTWAVHYIPYTYPHPFNSGVPPTDSTPPVISGTNVTAVTSTSFQVNWSTDEFTTNALDISTSAAFTSYASYDLAGSATSFSQTAGSLAPGILYYARIRAGDSFGNKATNVLSQTTSATDTTPPSFSATNITAITDSGATFTATVGESAKSGVTWGYTTATSTGSATNSSTFATSLSVTFTGATANTLVYARIWAQDAAGNTNSQLASFTTALAPGFVAGTTNITSITTNGATMTATFNEASRSGVTWGYTTATSTGTATNINYLVSPSVSFAGATENTLVYVRFWGSDTDGNTNSVLASFTTASGSDTGAPVFPPALLLR